MPTTTDLFLLMSRTKDVMVSRPSLTNHNKSIQAL